jgi:SAM-dependent methyltransferase
VNSSLEREAKFHDDISKGINISDSTIDYFFKQCSPATWFSDKLSRLNHELLKCIDQNRLKGKRVLVYGCGNDGAAVWFAKRGAYVDAIDISEMSCKNQHSISLKSGLVNNIKCHVMDAHNITLPHKYDIIYGNAILHHLNINKAREETYRLLKEGGLAVFRDVKEGNIFLRIFRKLTPFWRTIDEHPLTDKDISNLTFGFSQMKQSEYIFLLLPYIFFNRILNNVILPRIGNWRIPTFAHYDLFDRLDCILFRIFPFLRKQAWICLIMLKK